MKKIIIKICLSLCMFLGINHNANAGAATFTVPPVEMVKPMSGGVDCDLYSEYWNCDPSYTFTVPPAVIEGEKKPNDSGWANPPPPPPLPPPPPTDFGGGGPGISGDPPTSTFTVTVSASPKTGGSVSGGGSYNEGAQCTITATSANGYSFAGWTGSVSSTNNPYSFVVTGNCYIMAGFVSATYSPCGQNGGLNGNSDISKTLDTLKNYAANSNFERIGYMARGVNGESLYKAGNGLPNSGGTYTVPMLFDINYKLEWSFHSHPPGINYTLSHGDIYAIYELYKLQRIYDFSNFAYGIVNSQGEAYAIMISNIKQFSEFIVMDDLHNINSQWYEDLRKALDKAANAQLAEKVFAKALSDSGLSIMKATTITSASVNWQRIEYNTTTTQVETKPCN